MIIEKPFDDCLFIKGITGYCVRPDGTVWSCRNTFGMVWVKRSTKPKPDGYVRIKLDGEGMGKEFYVHRLIASAFIGDIPDGHVVNHKNCDKSDNRVENLEIISRGDNVRHAMASGLHRNCRFKR